MTGREREPGRLCRELIVVAGRRAGKSTAVVVFDIWIAAFCDHRGTLAPGEIGVALLISVATSASLVCCSTVSIGIMSSSEPLNSMIVNRTADTIELRNSISIEVRPCSYQTLCVVRPSFRVICDELAFWFTSADFANPDTEVLTAVRPGLITTNGPVLMVSVRRTRNAASCTKRTTSISARTARLTCSWPTVPAVTSIRALPQAEIDRALEKDPVRNRAEFLVRISIRCRRLHPARDRRGLCRRLP